MILISYLHNCSRYLGSSSIITIKIQLKAMYTYNASVNLQQHLQYSQIILNLKVSLGSLRILKYEFSFLVSDLHFVNSLMF